MKTKLSLSAAVAKIAAMIEFLRQLWGFVRPYRGRFSIGLLCGIFYGLVNGLLLGTVNVVIQWVLTIFWPVFALRARRLGLQAHKLTLQARLLMTQAHVLMVSADVLAVQVPVLLASARVLLLQARVLEGGF